MNNIIIIMYINNINLKYKDIKKIVMVNKYKYK